MIGRFETILWDIDGTLLDFEAAEDFCLKSCLAKQGAEVNENQLDIYKKINKSYWQRLEKGEVTKEALYSGRFADWFEAIGLGNMDPVKMNEDYQVSLGENPILYPESLDILKKLSKYAKQYITTNGSVVAQEGKLEKTGIGKLVDGVFISEQMGVPKPDKAFFDICAENIPDYNPDTTVIIGDSLSSDIKGGNNAGIACIWFNPKGLVNDTDLKIDATVTNLSEIIEVLKRI